MDSKALAPEVFGKVDGDENFSIDQENWVLFPVRSRGTMDYGVSISEQLEISNSWNTVSLGVELDNVRNDKAGATYDA